MRDNLGYLMAAYAEFPPYLFYGLFRRMKVEVEIDHRIYRAGFQLQGDKIKATHS